MQTDQSPSRDAVSKELDRLKWKLGNVSIDAMEGDNLAVTLCSRFDDADAEQDENGWSEAATEGCDATLAAIHALYSDAILALLTPAPATGEAKVERDAALRKVADVAVRMVEQGSVSDLWASEMLPALYTFARFERDHLTPATQPKAGEG